MMSKDKTSSLRGQSRWTMESGILVSLATVCATVEENKFGMIILFMRDTGSMTGPRVEVDSSMPMEMFMRASGKMIRLTGREFILKTMDLVIQVNGTKISNMVSVFKNGPTTPHTKGTIILK